MSQRICVVGAGIVGLACAARLVLDGHQVTILDPARPGSGSSAGNPAGISASSCLPAASPGSLAKVPGWLLNPDGPLSIRPGYLPRLAPWLLRFVLKSNPQSYRAGIAALWQITSRGADAWERLLTPVGAPEFLRRSGNLIVYRSEGQFTAEAASWASRAAMGLTVGEIDSAELRRRVPELAPAYQWAREVKDNARLRDPLEVSTYLADWLRAKGAEIRAEKVRRIAANQPGQPLVTTENASLRFDAVVLAAGASSAPLAAQVGVRAPLQPERGYSITYPVAPVALDQPIFSPSEKIMVSPLGDGLRLAGTAEFAGAGHPPNPRRTESLARLGRALFPDLPPLGQAQTWTGDRPSTPDGLPFIGPSKRSPRVICAFGHGHLGVTSAAVTSEAVSSLIGGQRPELDLTPYRTDRFGWLV